MKIRLHFSLAVALLSLSAAALADSYEMRIPVPGLRATSGASLSAAFSGATFTPCGALGTVGPTLAQCQSAYSYAWASNPAVFTVGSGNTQGFQYWTVTQTGTYAVTIAGAAGASGFLAGGQGAVVQGTLQLNQGDVLTLIVGQTPPGSSPYSGGGGGGSFLYNGSTLLFAAGGGGGGGGTPSSGNTATVGANSSVTAPGTGSGGGAGNNYAAGGAGATGAGGAGTTPFNEPVPATGGSPFSGGFVGGTSRSAPLSVGGFGGGGGGYASPGGGGGGYSGGAGGSGYRGGSAGTSFLGAAGAFTGATNAGNGYISVSTPQ